MILACAGVALTAAPGVGQTATVTLVGAGDIASCNYTRDSTTARLLGETTGTVYTLGDNVYPDGTLKQFRNCYRPAWGAYKARTKPSVGNHEYHAPNASGYFDYFGAWAGNPSRGATTATIAVAGISWSSKATATRWAAALGFLPKADG